MRYEGEIVVKCQVYYCLDRRRDGEEESEIRG